jgi:hypothetical protein
MATCRTRTCVFDFQGRCSTSELTCLEGMTPCVSRHTPRQSRAHRIDAHDSKSIPQRIVVPQSQIGACLQAPIPFGGGNRPIHCQSSTLANPLPDVRHLGARCTFPPAPSRQVQNVSQPKLILEQQNCLPWRWRAAAFTAAAYPALYRVESGAHAPRQQIHRLRSGQSVDGHQGVDDAPDLRPPSFNAPTKSDIHAPLYCSTLQLSRQTSSLVDEHLQNIDRSLNPQSSVCRYKRTLSSNLDCRRASNRRFAARPSPIAGILRHQSCGDTLAAHLEAATDAGHACPTYRGGLRSGR